MAARFELPGEILGRAAGARQLDDPDPELGRVRGTASRHANTLLRKSEGVHQTGATPGIDGMGRAFTIMSIDIHQVEKGRIVRAHHVEDWAGALRQRSGR